ncbi:polysaccharide pyruvyl transferase family protein [Halosimplex salinum]|uniref:polysaccharide pyruvyl transferase family protein n=1 Tax=Halosimplex salinum TaxID=1710538 RepID=UPI000F475D1C|nr:polysaccharide pyruvyl transferase family protein [Halosimplex salinum]
MSDVKGVLSDVAVPGEVLTVQPGGNHGDELIYRGFRRIADQIDVGQVPLRSGENRYDAPPSLPTANLVTYGKVVHRHACYLRHRLTTTPSAVYIHGGGNFNDIWREGIACYEAATRYFDCPVVVGPQSCRFESIDPSDLFGRVDNETHFFCREEYSYRTMKAAAAGHEHVSVYLDDDTALSLTADSLPVTERDPEYTLVAMRADAESADPLLQEDISAPIKVSDISVTADSFEEFVQTAADAEYVHTDRLHVAILASLLDTPVTWYEIGYHKSRGVYEHSLSHRDDVTFVSRDEAVLTHAADGD